MNVIENTSFEYDYIIIGTGPAGAVIAKTLSDHPEYSVLVLEAGDNNTNEAPIQTSSTDTWMWFPYYFWQGRTIPQRNVNGKMYNWTTGRTLGGGSSVNGGQYVRPTPGVLREWEDLLGPVWSPEQASFVFTQLEQYNGLNNDPGIHGHDGRLSIRQAPQQIPAPTQKLVDAITLATGYPVIQDYNNPYTPIGPFYRWQLYQQPNGQRESSATAFLSSDIITPEGTGVDGRNLTVFLKSTVLRILISDTMEAVGVEFLREGIQQTAYARKDIILAAGINSSQLLMLSGIGPAEILHNSGIPVIYNNPNVGVNLTNHTISSASFTINANDLPSLMTDPYALYNGGAFLPDPTTATITQRRVQLIGTVENGRLNILIIDLAPSSRGNIILQNNDPLKIVLADYNYFSNPSDIEFYKNIYTTYILNIAEVLSMIDPSYQLISPSFDIINNNTMLEAYIRDTLNTTYHIQGCNRMAPIDQGGVVNQWGEVYGIGRLIIADSTIVPYTVDCNTSSVAYLVGYTIANLLLQKENVPSQMPYPSYPSPYTPE